MVQKPKGFWLTASARGYIARVDGGVVFARVRVLTAQRRSERRRREKDLKVSPPHSPLGFATLLPKLSWCERSRCRETSISGVSAIARCLQVKSFQCTDSFP